MLDIKLKKEIILIVVAIILLAVVLVGYFVFNNSDEEDVINNNDARENGTNREILISQEELNELMAQGKTMREALKEIILKDADQETLIELEDGFYKDKNRIYDTQMRCLSESEQLKIDPETFEVGRCFIKDNDSVYLRARSGCFGNCPLEKIEGVDSESFTSIWNNFFKDKNNVYYGKDIVREADPESFEILASPSSIMGCYGRDNNRVYYFGGAFSSEIILNADLETFEVVKCGLLERIAKDKYRTYEHMVLEE